VLETAGAQSRGVDRFLPDTPLRVVIDEEGTDRTAELPAEAMDPHLRPGQIDDLLDQDEDEDEEAIVETLLPRLLSAAAQAAEAQAHQVIAAGLQRMQATLSAELARLHALQRKNNHVRPEEIALAESEMERLEGLIRGARVRLDGVMVVRRG
jgi:ATP-dependent helicase HepA